MAVPDVMVNPQSYLKLLREVSGSTFLTSQNQVPQTQSLILTIDQLTNPCNASAVPLPPKLLELILNTGAPKPSTNIGPQPTLSPPLVTSTTSSVEPIMIKSEAGLQPHSRHSSNK